MAIALRDMSEKDLKEQLENSYRELLKLRCTYALARSLTNPARVGHLKKTIARVLTLQRERGLPIGIPNLPTTVGKLGKKGTGNTKAKMREKKREK